ncbi:MAG: hypothetical protein F4106_04335, partial [Gemmatimonadetes bacterium]|nr:hypothetical protein [Gemmatimonadota bacterium]
MTDDLRTSRANRRPPGAPEASPPGFARILKDGVGVAIDALRGNWTRTLLAILGVGVGTGVV